jgi:hypothetical protein
MKIRELLEQTIGSVPPGQPSGSTPIPTTQNTSAVSSQPGGMQSTTSTNTANTIGASQQMNQIKSNLDSLKPIVKQANGGVDFDSMALAKMLSGETTGASAMAPNVVNALKALAPALGAAEKTQATPLKQAVQTAVTGQMKQQQQQMQQQNQPPR